MENSLIHNKNGIFYLFGNKDYELQRIRFEKDFFAGQRRIPVNRIVFPEQVHSDEIVIIDPIVSYCTTVDKPLHIPNADALITKHKERFLCIVTADCIPVFAYDEREKVVAAIHSGRTGTELNIVGKTLEYLMDYYGSEPADIHLILGPGISAPYYPVAEEMFNSFTAATQTEHTFPNLDLKKTIVQQANRKGILKIDNIDICTYSHPFFFSYRQNKTTQRQINIIGLY